MEKGKIKNIIIYIGIITVISAIGIGIGKLIDTSQPRAYDFGYEDGLEDGTRDAKKHYESKLQHLQNQCYDWYVSTQSK